MEPIQEVSEPSGTNVLAVIEETANQDDEMDEDDAAPEKELEENNADDKDLEASTALELTDDCDFDEPQVMPLDPDAVEKVVSLAVDRTKSMTLSQVEDVGIALSALAVKCHGQDVNQVLNVCFFKLILDFIRLH